MQKSKDRDAKNIIVSDFHVGGSTAIFPPKITLPPLMANENERIVTADAHQLKIYNHLMKSARLLRKKSEGKRKVITFNGDLIEGIHHYTIQLKVPMVTDMVKAFNELAETFLDEVGFSVKNGDEVRFVSGTESHTGFNEIDIVGHFRHLGATYHDELRTVQNGAHIWYAHQWVGVGKGHTEGNSIHNGLKSLYYDCLKEGTRMPDVVIGSHFHKAALGSFSQRFKTYYGIITPSLQMKTRYAQKVSAFQRNDVGLIEFDVTTAGMPVFYEPLLM